MSDVEQQPSTEPVQSITTRRLRGWAVFGLIVIVFGVVPLVLGLVGEQQQQQATEQGGSCDDRISTLRSAMGLFRVQEFFPFWVRSAQSNQRWVVGDAGRLCESTGNGYPTAALEFVREYGELSEVDNILRNTESSLLSAGQFQAIIDYEQHSPRGGVAQYRMFAYLLRGDLQGAARVAGHPDNVGEVFDSMPPAAVLCAAGKYDAGLLRYAAEEPRPLNHPADGLADDFLAGYAECLLRAGRYEQLEKLLDRYELRVYRSIDRIVAYYRLAAAVNRGDQAAAYTLVKTSARSFALPGSERLLRTLVLIRQGEWRAKSLEVAATSQVLEKIAAAQEPALEKQGVRNISGHEALMRRLVEELVEAGRPGYRRVAAELHLELAARLAYRWDPQADHHFARSAELAPGWTAVNAVRSYYGFMHHPAAGDPRLKLRFPRLHEPGDALAALRSRRSRKYYRICRMAHVYEELTEIIVLGTLLAQDVGAEKAELAAHRRVNDSQANRVFMHWSPYGASL